MSPASFTAFSDEMVKISAVGERLALIPHLWHRFMDLFRSKDEKAQRRVDYHFSPKAGDDKWRKLIANSRDPRFLDALSRHPDADDKLVQHARAMGALSRGRVVGKIRSSTSPGKTYEIRDVGGRLGCQCGDWRYKGSVNPNYDCKHIRAFKAGKEKAD